MQTVIFADVRLKEEKRICEKIWYMLKKTRKRRARSAATGTKEIDCKPKNKKKCKREWYVRIERSPDEIILHKQNDEL